MSDNKVNIEINGEAFAADKGEMLIAVADRNGIHIPRFCYHSKLSVAANCRMCLVEQVGGRKPMPACATPVGDGQKFFTQSPTAIKAQKATMEFLLINHPLDCPICDQGGECELQDVAIGYGDGVSRYTERKRVVKDKSIGPLVSTDMTRCIHCTRCVRFGQEIAGVQELGTIGRGEFTEIGTYIENSVDHELSGNIIDLCPVGALNSKPFRFQARGWEMTQHHGIAPHDSLGSNIFAHVRRGKLLRVVPRNNESINETWLSDRDRFSYKGIYSDERLQSPMIKRNGEWEEATWQNALEVAAEGIKRATESDKDQLVTMASARATIEELYLLNRLTRGLGSNNIDHRLLAQDLSDQNADPLAPSFGINLNDLAEQDAILMIGSNLRAEAPLLAHRLRSAANAGKKILIANPEDFYYYFDTTARAINVNLVGELAGILAALRNESASDEQKAIADALQNAEKAHVFLGNLAITHANFATVRRLAYEIAQISNASFGYLPLSANSVGASLAGAQPHREVGGRPITKEGLNATQFADESRKAYLLFGIEPEFDVARPYQVREALKGADITVAITSYVTDSLRADCDVLLPLGTFAETAGTYVNCEGIWQTAAGIANPVGEARPGWKILRVLGNLFDLGGFEQNSAADVLQSLRAELGEELELTTTYNGNAELNLDNAANHAYIDLPIYAADPVLRRSQPLQDTRAAKEAGNAFFKNPITVTI